MASVPQEIVLFFHIQIIFKMYLRPIPKYIAKLGNLYYREGYLET